MLFELVAYNSFKAKEGQHYFVSTTDIYPLLSHYLNDMIIKYPLLESLENMGKHKEKKIIKPPHNHTTRDNGRQICSIFMSILPVRFLSSDTLMGSQYILFCNILFHLI